MNPIFTVSLRYSQWHAIITALSGDDPEVHAHQPEMARHLTQLVAKSPWPEIQDLQAVYDEANELLDEERLLDLEPL